MDFKKAGDFIYVVGTTKNEMGASTYLETKGFIGNTVPKVDAGKAKILMDKLSKATEKGLVRACHDCSEGGLGVAIAEMAFAGGLGATIYLKSVSRTGPLYRDDYVLFSESNSRFLVEVSPSKEREFIKMMSGIASPIGHVNDIEALEVHGLSDNLLFKVPIGDLKEAWQKPLRW